MIMMIIPNRNHAVSVRFPTKLGHPETILTRERVRLLRYPLGTLMGCVSHPLNSEPDEITYLCHLMLTYLTYIEFF